jgi:MFS family permease
MLDRMKQATAGYPRQFWLLFWGMLISTANGSMIWPFLTIYMRQQLATTTVAGPAVDRFSRKELMVLSLAVNGATLLAMSTAGTLQLWVVLRRSTAPSVHCIASGATPWWPI